MLTTIELVQVTFLALWMYAIAHEFDKSVCEELFQYAFHELEFKEVVSHNKYFFYSIPIVATLLFIAN